MFVVINLDLDFLHNVHTLVYSNNDKITEKCRQCNILSAKMSPTYFGVLHVKLIRSYDKVVVV